MHGGQGGLEGPKRRFATGIVPVKTKHYLRHDAKQPLEVGLAGRGAQRGDGVGDAVLSQRDHIHIPLHHHNALDPTRMFARLPEPIEFSGFLKDRGFGGV